MMEKKVYKKPNAEIENFQFENNILAGTSTQSDTRLYINGTGSLEQGSGEPDDID